MAFSGGFDDLSGSELLDEVDALAVRQREIETELLVAAQSWAVRHSGEALRRKDGRGGWESARSYGGNGTPDVATFAGAAFGARMGRSSYAGGMFIADALDLAYRLPQLWGRVQDGEVLASYARFVARKTRELEKDQAANVDARVAEAADGRITWSRFEALVEAAIKAADPEAARAREEKSRKHQFAKQTRVVTDGLAGFFVRADVATIAQFDATVGFLAKVLTELGVEETDDRRRVLAVAVLANPAQAAQLLAAYAAWKRQPTHSDQPEPTEPAEPNEPAESEPPTDAELVMMAVLELARLCGWEPDGSQPQVDWGALLPRVQLLVHVYAGELTSRGLARFDHTGLARIEGYGTVTEAWVREMLGPLARFTVRPVLDLAGQAPVDAWEIPDRHRRAVRLMTPADCFPYSTATVNKPDGWIGMQLDHTARYRHAPDEWEPGQSRIGNYSPLTQFHHNLKTHGGWQVQQPYPGIYVWRDPHGGFYLVDHTGTQRIRTTRRTTPIRLELVDYDPSAA